MSNLVVQDLLNATNDLLANYTTGNIDLGNRMRAINRAIEYIKRRMTFPSDELVQKISFTQDNMFYNLNPDFNEGLMVYYDDLTQNFPGNEWRYMPYGDLLRMSGKQFTTRNYFSWVPINGKMQLMLFGSNLNQGSTIVTFDSLSSPPTITAINDAENARIDTNIFVEGSGSLAFDINPALGGSGKASIYLANTNFDFTQLLDSNGFFKLSVWLASTNITSIDITLFTDALDSYTLSTTTFDDGTAFSTGLDTWKKIQLGFTNNVVVGSPAIDNITAMQIDFVLGPGFTLTDSFRIDNLYTIYPDLLDFVYLTSYKGTASDGVTNKIFLTDPADIPAFGNFVPDMLDVIAYRAAIILVPQIMSNTAFRDMYLQESEEVMKVVGRSWPRKRALNMGSLVLRR